MSGHQDATGESGRKPTNDLIDTDGLPVRGSTVIPGAAEFLARSERRGAEFPILTNNSLDTRRDLPPLLAARVLVRGPTWRRAHGRRSASPTVG